MILKEIKEPVRTKKLFTVIDVKNVKVGDTLNFPSSKDYQKVVRRKVSGFEICAIRKDNLHIRISYKIGNVQHQPLLETVLHLNPHLKAEPVQVESFLREGIFKSKIRGEQPMYQECIAFKGSIAPLERPFIKVTDNE